MQSTQKYRSARQLPRRTLARRWRVSVSADLATTTSGDAAVSCFAATSYRWIRIKSFQPDSYSRVSARQILSPHCRARATHPVAHCGPEPAVLLMQSRPALVTPASGGPHGLREICLASRMHVKRTGGSRQPIRRVEGARATRLSAAERSRREVTRSCMHGSKFARRVETGCSTVGTKRQSRSAECIRATSPANEIIGEP